jgi:hypothetical protein
MHRLWRPLLNFLLLIYEKKVNNLLIDSTLLLSSPAWLGSDLTLTGMLDWIPFCSGQLAVPLVVVELLST